MTAITADLAGPLSLLNRDFQSRFLQSIEALTAATAPADQWRQVSTARMRSLRPTRLRRG